MGFLPVSRRGDKNTTFGSNVGSSFNVRAQKRGVSRTGDTSRCNPPATQFPTTIITLGNPRILVNKRPKARVTTNCLPPCTIPATPASPPIPIPTILIPPGAIRVLV